MGLRAPRKEPVYVLRTNDPRGPVLNSRAVLDAQMGKEVRNDGNPEM